MILRQPRRRAARLAAALRDNRSGVALLEFALGSPLILAMGMYCLETCNLALVNLRVSQIALNLADNMSRVGMDANLSTQQLREVDINDALQGARYQGTTINLTTQGRVTVTSLENVQRTFPDGSSDTAAVQRIHWQRCIGKKSGTGYDDSYNGLTGSALVNAGSDNTKANAGKDMIAGMGDAGALVKAPDGSGLMFVEINYEYKPIISKFLMTGTSRIHYIASFIVRDNRDFSRIYNPVTTPETPRSTCDKYSA